MALTVKDYYCHVIDVLGDWGDAHHLPFTPSLSSPSFNMAMEMTPPPNYDHTMKVIVEHLIAKGRVSKLSLFSGKTATQVCEALIGPAPPRDSLVLEFYNMAAEATVNLSVVCSKTRTSPPTTNFESAELFTSLITAVFKQTAMIATYKSIVDNIDRQDDKTSDQVQTILTSLGVPLPIA